MPPKARSSSRKSSRGRSRSTGAKRKTSRSKTPTRKATEAKAEKAPTTRTVQEEYQYTAERRFTPEKDRWDGKYDFGGPLGALGIMLFSHFIIFYFYVCIEKFQGSIIYPGHSLLAGDNMYIVFRDYLKVHAHPTCRVFVVYMSFLLLEYILALVLPGVTMRGLPLPSENGYRLNYKCNAVAAWYCMLLVVGALHYTGVFPLNELRRDFGHYLCVATILGDLFSIWVYFCGLRRRIRMTGNKIYDFFMGTALNYRLPGDVDVKMFAECRNSWVILMLITLSCAAEQYRELGYITGNMAFMVFAHLLYVNAVQKGEECIVTTWDIFHEKFGWMLCYWNTCGVPFLYCMQSVYIQTVLKDQSHAPWILAVMFCALIPIYWIWDNLNSQKNRFRMMRCGVPMEILRRRTFPQLPWAFIENPRTLKSSKGELFVDGWYRYGRKLHYTLDVMMSLLWGLSCGVSSVIPFFYSIFFVSHLIDRERRDERRCRAKYGKLWDEYVELVPYKFIPYVY